MQYGVKEYWIVNPLFNMIQVYLLNEDGHYIQTTALKETGKAHSSVIDGFVVQVESSFELESLWGKSSQATSKFDVAWLLFPNKFQFVIDTRSKASLSTPYTSLSSFSANSFL